MSNIVSIIIPVYNNELEVGRAIRSVLSQTIQDFELIVVDDESSDNSVNIINLIKDKRIKYFKQLHGGASKARNFGVSKAQSDFIAFLDADDEWKNVFLETVILLRNKYPDAGLYCTNYSYVEKPNINIFTHKIKIENVNEEELVIENYFKYILSNEPINICTSCTAMNKTVFEELNGFNINSIWGEDQDLWGRIAIRYPIVYSNTIGAIIYTIQDITNLHTFSSVIERIKKTKQHPFIESGKKALRDDSVPNFLKKDLKEVIALYQIISSSYNLLAGNFLVSKKILNKCDTSKYKLQKIYQLLYTKIPGPFDQIFGKRIYQFILFRQYKHVYK